MDGLLGLGLSTEMSTVEIEDISDSTLDKLDKDWNETISQ